MKKLVFLFLLSMPLLCSAQQIGIDKMYHTGVGFGIGTVTTAITLPISKSFGKSLGYSVLLGFVAGTGKESWDYFVEGEMFDPWDLTFTFFGAFAGSCLTGVVAMNEKMPFQYRKIIKEKKMERISSPPPIEYSTSLAIVPNGFMLKFTARF